MAANVNRSPPLLVRIMKGLKSRIRSQPDQCIRLRFPVRVTDALRLPEHVFDERCFTVFFKNCIPAFPLNRVRMPDGGKAQHRLRRNQQLRIFCYARFELTQGEEG